MGETLEIQEIPADLELNKVQEWLRVSYPKMSEEDFLEVSGTLAMFLPAPTLTLQEKIVASASTPSTSTPLTIKTKLLGEMN